MTIHDQLIANGWREYPDQFKHLARCFCKRFDTPTRCRCNDSKPGVQVCIAVSTFINYPSMELELQAELKDGTWLNLHNHGLPKTLPEVTALIPRLLAVWEAANGHDSVRELTDASWDLLKYNGGPVDSSETVDGQEYVLVRRDDFKRIQTALGLNQKP